MTPKEKAIELVEKMFSLSTTNAFPAKQCALIAVDEILKVVSVYNDSQVEVIYFKEVRKEIENL